MSAIKVAIVADHPVVCAGLATMLQSWSRGKVVLKARNGEEYEQALRSAGPMDIALIDVCMPVCDELSILEWMRVHQQGTLPLMLSHEPTPELVAKVVRLGARGIVSKAIRREELHLAMDHVCSTGFYMNEYMRQHLLGMTVEHHLEPEGRDRVLGCLTRRELDVIEAICAHDDPTYTVIAERLGISEHTVHTHRARLFEKLGVSNRQGLLRAAMNWKLLKRPQGRRSVQGRE